jgi:polar amino acid transport system substrate-binding protein
MNNFWSRRRIVSGLAAMPLAAPPKVWAQAAGAGQGTLARLRAAKSVTVGIPNFPPYSGIESDGSLTGIAPAITKVIMGRLGVPEIKGISVPGYAELIPGMQAGRWEFICACMSISKARCAQVAFADPLVIDGAIFVALKGELPNMPKTVADLVTQKIVVATGVAEVYSRFALATGVSRDHVLEFPNDVAMLDALVAKRVQVVFQGGAAITRAYKARNLAVDTTYPVPDYPSTGSTCAFRTNDSDLLAAFQQELRAMKASGEFLTISRENGFDPAPSLIPITIEQACAAAG